MLDILTDINQNYDIMINQKQIAQEFKVTEGLISRILKGDRFTPNRLLAMEISRLSGKPPIEHMTKSMRDVFLRAYPELSRKFK
jgi:transcriptional regulator with XRE-family HTH domain